MWTIMSMDIVGDPLTGYAKFGVERPTFVPFDGIKYSLMYFEDSLQRPDKVIANNHKIWTGKKWSVCGHRTIRTSKVWNQEGPTPDIGSVQKLDVQSRGCSGFLTFKTRRSTRHRPSNNR